MRHAIATKLRVVHDRVEPAIARQHRGAPNGAAHTGNTPIHHHLEKPRRHHVTAIEENASSVNHVTGSTFEGDERADRHEEPMANA
jgi:hypothetical protein